MKKAVGFLVGFLAGAASVILLVFVLNMIFGLVHIK